MAATGALDGGVVLSATWASGVIDDDVVEVVGTEGAVRVSRYESLGLSSRGRSVPSVGARLAGAVPTPEAVAFSLARRRAPWNDPSFAAALDNFVTAGQGQDRGRAGRRRGLAQRAGRLGNCRSGTHRPHHCTGLSAGRLR